MCVCVSHHYNYQNHTVSGTADHWRSQSRGKNKTPGRTMTTTTTIPPPPPFTLAAFAARFPAYPATTAVTRIVYSLLQCRNNWTQLDCVDIFAADEDDDTNDNNDLARYIIVGRSPLSAQLRRMQQFDKRLEDEDEGDEATQGAGEHGDTNSVGVDGVRGKHAMHSGYEYVCPISVSTPLSMTTLDKVFRALRRRHARGEYETSSGDGISGDDDGTNGSDNSDTSGDSGGGGVAEPAAKRRRCAPTTMPPPSSLSSSSSSSSSLSSSAFLPPFDTTVIGLSLLLAVVDSEGSASFYRMYDSLLLTPPDAKLIEGGKKTES
jgi:hypothetical protein